VNLPLASDLPSALQHGLLAQLDLPDPDSYDELRAGDASLRPAWERFFGWLPRDETPAHLDRRLALIAQQIRVDGVTHNVYGEHGASARPWSLELLPLLIEPADWAVIERGVVQRANLLNRMLADVYGEQRLLSESLLPPALLFRNPGYLRPLHGAAPAGGLHLHIAAFDLARGPDGGWWVVSQRTQSPSGLGYVLHNRLIVSRLFPEAFREMRVQHIASSYRRLLDTVESLARQVAGGNTPRVVLLTPGPYNETYFEHAYLARYLGLPLVEGGDLTVRGDRLYLRTVEGLEPVHGLLRRLDDDFCDPLELRPDSTLGVPGLLQVVRAGNVVMANALGSAFLESPAIQGFLPAISRRLLGEELALPSLPSWWCGEAAAWRAVRDSLSQRVLRPAFPTMPHVDGVSLPDSAAVPEWQRRIDDDPDAWMVQGHVRFARAPLWHQGAAVSRPAMLRVYAIADDAQRWHVLPGGMTRVATRSPFSVSMQQGGSSLDTWVMTDGLVDTFSMLPARLRVDDIATRRRPVASRTAENLFWLGRYTERTEQGVRLARALLNLMDSDSDAPLPVLDAVSTLAMQSGLAAHGTPSFTRAPQVFERSVLAALADDQGANSVAFNLQALASAAGALRDRLSPEHSGLVRSMAEDFQAHFAALDVALFPGAARQVPSVAQALPALDHLAMQLAAVTGAQTDRMTRDHGWRLLTVGRLIERLVGMARAFGTLLDATALQSASGLDLLLELFDSTITFRARYQRHEDLLALVDLLVLDDANPRAFAGTLRRLRTELSKLPGSPELLVALRQHLPAEGAGLTLAELRDASDADVRACVSRIAARLQQAGTRLSDDVGQHFFAHTEGGDRLHRL
jgi:uncharacterized circularly permuted ATP-grasp superfamily protein/uncharacterized alpha-E superfamily protein